VERLKPVCVSECVCVSVCVCVCLAVGGKKAKFHRSGQP